MIRVRRTIQFQDPEDEQAGIWVFAKTCQYRVDNKLSTEKEMLDTFKAEGVKTRVIKQKREKVK